MKDYCKRKIIDAFSDSVDYYADHASLQHEIAQRMARALEPWQYSVPHGTILEVGAGTGFFTEYLIKMLGNRNHKIMITDASEEMTLHCRERFEESDRVSFDILDIEEQNWIEDSYSMITGNFMIHWIKDPSSTLLKMSRALKPGGFMLMSFPGSESFPQWRKYCTELGLPFTGNPLPDVEQLVVNLSMGPVKVDFYEDQSTEEYPDLFTFYRHLKNCGSSTSFTGKKLMPKQLKLLNSYWSEKNNGRISVHYHTAFIAVKKDL
jgi:malonyl-CoA O-methyltransferase